ncbi:hypothetical protein HMPREF3213_03537 [Heyndrickxia coagulans]|uniref:Uncharacterized protein n=1 Tax=Heyndrickxia coagulans TaxID=1398 RepID=A0A133KBP3_HEYCO|nr:hypothetical protein HMPREF3213_03537 [Heyndrickxia coagulans]
MSQKIEESVFEKAILSSLYVESAFRCKLFPISAEAVNILIKYRNFMYSVSPIS